MQIVSGLSGTVAVNVARSDERPSGESFADVFEKVASTAGKAKADKVEKSASQIKQEKEAATEAAYKAVLAELHDYMKKTPAEHIRDAVLKELGLTEADLAAMPPEKRMAMEATINELVREKLLGRKPEPDQESASAQLLDQDASKGTGAVADALQMALAGDKLTMTKVA